MKLLETSNKLESVGKALDYHFDNEHSEDDLDSWEVSAACEKCRRLFKESEDLLKSLPFIFKIFNSIIHPILSIKALAEYKAMHEAFDKYDNKHTPERESEGH